MPNICENYLTVWSDSAQTLNSIALAAAPPPVSSVSKWTARLRGKATPIPTTGLLHFLCPMPVDLDSVEVEIFEPLAREPRSYHWRVQNWGCRHDLSTEPTVHTPSELQFQFPTDYAPPIPALQHGANTHGFRFRLLYCEPGTGFCGIATESTDEVFEFTLERPPSEEGVPTELDELFGLLAMYEKDPR